MFAFAGGTCGTCLVAVNYLTSFGSSNIDDLSEG